MKPWVKVQSTILGGASVLASRLVRSLAPPNPAALLCAGILFVGLGKLAAQDATTNGVRFVTVDIFVDSHGESLAAYQLEFSATNGVVKIAGIEGGEHPAFRAVPHYDSKAMQQERVILAAFSTENQLPFGKTRVATIHLQVTGATEPQFTVKLETAANSAAKKISGEASFEERKGK